MKLTEHEKKILELVQSNPVILTNRDERRKIAEKIGLTEKTLRNRIADLKKYGVIGNETQLKEPDASVSRQEDMIFISIFLIIWRAKWKIFRNVFIVSVLSVILALIMPLTYRSVAVIMPPSSETGLNISSALSALPFGNLIGRTGDSKGRIFIAILESRTVQEDIINTFDLMEFYDDKYIEDALMDLSDNTSIELQEEGTIKIAFTAKTSWFHPEDEIQRCKTLARDIANYYVAKLDEVNKRKIIAFLSKNAMR
ncbi:MAG: Wzz/FepE/Etk N-terminal domain-containing protein [Fidelibacterota bacterium]